jgi:hypothetical protein
LLATAAQHYVSAIDVFAGLGWLPASDIRRCRQGCLLSLQQALQVSPEKIVRLMELLREWAQQLGLRPDELLYLAGTARSRRELRFSTHDDPELEKSFRPRFFDPTISEKRLGELRNKLSQAPEVVVFWIVGDSQCSQ